MRLIDEAYLQMHKVHGIIDNIEGDFVSGATIARAPTIDAEPIVEAEWIDRPSGRYGRWQSWCSACGEHNRIGGIESNRHRPRCPHCGARMKNGG